MRDLNATMFYKAKFNVTAKNPDECDLLWKLVMDIRGWITGKLNRYGHMIVEADMKRWTAFKMGGKLYDLEGGNRFFAESLRHVNTEDPADISWACMIVEKTVSDSGYAPRQWTTEIGFRTVSKGSAEISYVVTYSDMPGFVGPCQDMPSITVPNVIRNLLSDSSLICRIGNSVLTAEPKRLAPEDYPAFEKLLLDPERELPILYISPKRVSPEEDTAHLLVSEKKVAETVVANALVFFADDLGFSEEMRHLGNAAYSCYGGAIRVYFPHINPENKGDQYRHRYIAAKDIEENGEEYVLHIFRRALAQDVHFYEKMFRLENCKELHDMDAHRARIETIRQQSEGVADEAMEEFLKESERRESAERQVEICKSQIDDQARDIYSLNLRLDSFADMAKRYELLENANEGVRRISEFPDSPQRIARYFETVYPERIAFTERGYLSLKDCITKNDVLWEAFYHMANELYDLLQDDPATAYKTFKEVTGWDCSRGEGTMTRKDAKLMRQYEDTYHGQEINIEAHIKSGTKDSDPRSVRIYFAYDPTVAPQLLIGHCGKHLDNYSTRKVK